MKQYYAYRGKKKKKEKFIAPLFVMIPRKNKADRKVSCNLNEYRNLHYQTNNKAKQIFKEMMFNQLCGVRFTPPVKISFQLFKPSRRRSDKANFLSVVEKYFCDALVDTGCLPDDSDDYILSQEYLPTVYDKGNGRVEIIVEEC